ncbi:hypothetical protein ACFL1B_01110 [Nanoarchaeota archaeon]
MNFRVISILIIFVLVFLCGFLFIGNTTRQASINHATDMTKDMRTLFKHMDYKCRALPGAFEDMNECVVGAISELKVRTSMEEDDFKNFQVKTNTSGHLVLKNSGTASMESAHFVLYKNHVEVDKGCVIEGKIDSQYLCRLNFDSVCESGDVLEVKYQDERVYIKTC